MKKTKLFKKYLPLFISFVLIFSFTCTYSPIHAGTITILEPQTGWGINNVLNVRATVSGTSVAKVELYYATGSNAYSPTPTAVQNAISGRTDYFFSVDLTGYANTTTGKIKLVSRDSSNNQLDYQEVTSFKKTNTSTSISGVKDGSTVLKDTNGNTTGTRFAVWSQNAAKVQVWIYGNSDTGTAVPNKVVDLVKQSTQTLGGYYWAADVLNDGTTTYGNGLNYGLRVWGPNFTYNTDWRPGTLNGFTSDVDASGNRYNPNKLLIDPYAKAISKDPSGDQNIFTSGTGYNDKDSAGPAPKSIVYDSSTYSWGTDAPLKKATKDTVIYEMQIRGFTENSNSGVANPGTYKGVSQKISYLNDLGVTDIEMLPVQETGNDQNDNDPNSDSGDNYWGYSTLNYFAPDRRYSSDKSALGPITEFKDMVKTLHSNGKEVVMDVVYNHTAEGGILGSSSQATILSFRGIDNQAYYELTSDAQSFYDNTGCGGNFNTANPKVTQFIMDSLNYWATDMHVDGFRFDLAPVLGNTVQKGGYNYDKTASLLNRIYQELPNTKMIAEPWAIGGNSYQVGNFPGSVDSGQNAWNEWNDHFRDTMRSFVKGDNNKVSDLATRVAGSSDLYGDDGRRPYNSINFITAHDGFTLNDLVSYNTKSNLQAWPYGPSDGGTDNNLSWDCGGDDNIRRQQIRNFSTLQMFSAGTPMILGGDEMRRSQKGNNNAYNLDSIGSWYDWSNLTTNQGIYNFYKGIIALRKSHEALKRTKFYAGSDHDNDGIPDIQWSGVNYLSPDWSSGSHTLAWRVEGTKAETGASVDDNDFYIAANLYWGSLNFQLPPNKPGKKWYRVIDTAVWAENAATISNNIDTAGQEDLITDGSWTNTFATSFAGNSSYNYNVNARSTVVFIEK